MKQNVTLLILLVVLLFGGTLASVAVSPKYRVYMEAQSLAEPAGETLKARVLKKAEMLNVPTEGRTLQEIAVSVKKKIKVKKESIRMYKTVIRSFSGAFVHYSL